MYESISTSRRIVAGIVLITACAAPLRAERARVVQKPESFRVELARASVEAHLDREGGVWVVGERGEERSRWHLSSLDPESDRDLAVAEDLAHWLAENTDPEEWGPAFAAAGPPPRTAGDCFGEFGSFLVYGGSATACWATCAAIGCANAGLCGMATIAAVVRGASAWGACNEDTEKPDPGDGEAGTVLDCSDPDVQAGDSCFCYCPGQSCCAWDEP